VGTGFRKRSCASKPESDRVPLTALLTGFGPFPGAPFNPTAALAQRLAVRRRPAFADIKRVAHLSETSYAAVERELPALIKRVRPDVVLLFGVATRTKYLRIETRARNARSPLFPDAAGERPGGAVIDLGGPVMRMGRAPQPALLAAVRAQRLPARLSHSAGRYLCNFAYWRALAATDISPAPLVQFIHVPTVRRAPMRPGTGRRLTAADLERAGAAALMTLLVAARARRRLLAPVVAAPVEVQRKPKRERRQALAG
jgi:pyroglutamyl-peptidase